MIEVQFPGYNVTKKEYSGEIYLRLYVSAFKSGLFAKMKPVNSMVLLAICSYMDEKGECYPTQRQIADRVGVSLPTVNKAVNELLEMEINGKPIICRILTGKNRNSVYTVNPISQVAIFSSEIEAIEEDPQPVQEEKKKKQPAKPKGLTTNNVIDHFFNTYVEVYSVRPKVNFTRAAKEIRENWLGKYTDEQILKMVEIGVRDYEKNWATPKYDRPTITAIISWIGEKILGDEIKRQKEFEEVQDLTSSGDDMNQAALNRLQNVIKK